MPDLDYPALNDVCECGHHGNAHDPLDIPQELGAPGRCVDDACGCFRFVHRETPPEPTHPTCAWRSGGRYRCGRGHGTLVYILLRGWDMETGAWGPQYVGQTSNLKRRMSQHKTLGRDTRHPRVLRCSTAKVADILESHLIDTAEPDHNKQRGLFHEHSNCWSQSAAVSYPDPWAEVLWLCDLLKWAPPVPQSSRQRHPGGLRIRAEGSYYLPGTPWVATSPSGRDIVLTEDRDELVLLRRGA